MDHTYRQESVIEGGYTDSVEEFAEQLAMTGVMALLDVARTGC